MYFFFFWGGLGGVMLGRCSVSFMQLCNGLVRSSCCVHVVAISRLVVFFQWTSCSLLVFFSVFNKILFLIKRKEKRII